uniref:IPPc domain-containing protein n=1 Tax=Soboliphyme baturini TaxID=241478 RepID=A0A183J5B0_9BILA
LIECCLSFSAEPILKSDLTLFAGNFNTSLDKAKLLNDQTLHNQAATTERRNSFGEIEHIFAMDGARRKIYNIDLNHFDFCDLHDWLFGTCNGQLIRKYDRELESYKGALYEANIYFPPTDPYAFNRKTESDEFLRNKCPAWRSRVFYNQLARDRIHYVSTNITFFITIMRTGEDLPHEAIESPVFVFQAHK